MTIAAVSHAASHGAASQVVPSGKSNQEQQILLMLILAAVIIFIQADKSGKPQNGSQYAALGVVGFILLVIAQFWAEFAFAMTVLFLVSIILNSPNGVPVIGNIANSSVNNAVAGSAPESSAEQAASAAKTAAGGGTLPAGVSEAGGGTDALHG